MGSLFIYLKDYKKETILAPLFKMLEASFELMVPLVMAAVIDVGIAGKDRLYIIKMCLVLIALGLIGLVCSITAQYFSARAAAGFGTGVRHALFVHIQELTFTDMDTLGSSTLITRMTSDINQAQSGVNLMLRLFLRSPFIVFGAMIMAFTVDAEAALIFVVVIPLLSVVVFGLMLITMPLYRKVQSNLDKILLTTRENLSGVRVIRAFNKQEPETERFERENRTLTDAQKFAGRISGLMNPLTYVIVNGGIIALIYAGAIRVDAGNLSQGQVVALINYMSQILVELVKLANLIITVTKAAACAKRIQSVLSVRPDMECGSRTWTEAGEESRTGIDRTAAVSSQAAVEFSHVSLTYRGAGGESLSDINFRAEKGQIIGLVGSNGSGKTTLIKTILQLLPYQEGTIQWKEQAIKDIFEDIAYITDTLSFLPDMSPKAYGAFLKDFYPRFNSNRYDRILQHFEIDSRKKLKKMSAGQKLKVEIAAGFSQGAHLLLLDEPFSNLDVFSKQDSVKMLLSLLNDEETVLISSHDIDDIDQVIDRAVVLRRGRIVQDVVMEELHERGISLKECLNDIEKYDPNRVNLLFEEGSESHVELPDA